MASAALASFRLSCIVIATGPMLLAQIGGDGRDGPFTPTQSVTLFVDQQPGGVYQFTTMRIPAGVTVLLRGTIPAQFLVQGDVQIDGVLNASGDPPSGSIGGSGGPGGYAGGNGGYTSGGNGSGPGGGGGAPYRGASGGPAGHAEPAQSGSTGGAPGRAYGTVLPFDLRGGSGAGGSGGDLWGRYSGAGGHGGGGTIVIQVDGRIQVSGQILADGARTGDLIGGSGGSVLLRSMRTLTVSGSVSAYGTPLVLGYKAGHGFIRFDAFEQPPLVAGSVRPAPVTFRLPGIHGDAVARIGQPFAIPAATLWPNETIVYFAGIPGPPITTPFGDLLLDPNQPLLGLGVGTPRSDPVDPWVDFSPRVPFAPVLVGLRFGVQGFSVPGGKLGARLTNSLVVDIAW